MPQIDAILFAVLARDVGRGGEDLACFSLAQAGWERYVFDVSELPRFRGSCSVVYLRVFGASILVGRLRGSVGEKAEIEFGFFCKKLCNRLRQIFLRPCFWVLKLRTRR